MATRQHLRGGFRKEVFRSRKHTGKGLGEQAHLEWWLGWVAGVIGWNVGSDG